ncbi:MAG: hypothetical protein IKX56_05635 [Muribaculaceae bacterium]|nr:hypothetical protein [Muribaculaceae bacterium]
MRTKLIIMCALMVSLNCIDALAQQSYPDSIFAYEMENRITYKGKAPKIGDFLSSYLDIEETGELFGSVLDAWRLYLRQQPQKPCEQFMLDEKNGYLRYTFDSQSCDFYDDLIDRTYYEMCYWNCADGKHKLIAENCFTLIDNKYILGQYSGISFFLYDNASHKMWTVAGEDIGAWVEEVIDESNCETGEQLTDSDIPIVVYHLPQQGKDINVEICHGNKRTVTRLVWDGMRFKRE